MAFEPSQPLREYTEKLIPRYPQKRSAIMMILHFIQREQGFISLEAQEWVAAQLDLQPIQVREVVTFYPFYREHPVGKKFIRVCRTLSCALNGGYKVCDKFLAEFDAKLGHTSPDGRVTVEFAECLASCGTAPVAMIDDDLYENLTEDKVKELCDRIKAEVPAETPAPAADTHHH
ncbi:MAG: NAD(P)H-dependent oxidoreductase subunit E [Verrucomicrobiota bacterium JB022]|nr:NAD(P)H-dependent oxidoreductase subunit E [Verrucomicrobiota bacterium JB022]